MSDARFVPYAVEAGPEAPPLLPGLSWADLFDPCRLRDLDGAFLARLSAEEPDVAARLVRYRAGEELAPTAVSELLVAAARPLSRFLAGLFGVEAAREKLLAAARSRSSPEARARASSAPVVGASPERRATSASPSRSVRSGSSPASEAA
ncbi:MAG: hypothetical protein DYH06_23050, partial [Acidobacteria bacterium ACB2]|nr:hypothetical protein [Acidobacteria bacterium ACB2]